MDRYHKGLHFRSSNSPTSSATPKPSLSGQNDENELKRDQMDSKSQNSKKPFHKHFMSPTVSATSKATVPRKKILAERNESTASLDVQFQESPILETGNPLLHSGTSQCARSSSGAIFANDSASRFDDDERDTTSIADSSLKPYDPLTNYLSPRPQYLRYKPNRRQEILERQLCLDEKKDGSFLERSSSFESNNIGDELKSLDCVRDSLISPSLEGTGKLNNQETVWAEKDNCGDDSEVEEEEDEEEEIQEFEEEKTCSLKGLLKFLLLLVFMGLSTSYIPSTTSPMSSPAQLSIDGRKDGCHGILNHSVEAIPANLHGGDMRWPQTRKAQAGFFGVNQQNRYREFGKFQMVVHDEPVLVDGGDDIARVFESLNEQNLDICNHAFDESDRVLVHPFNVNTAGSKDVDCDQADFDLPQWDIAENVILDGEIDMMDDSFDQNPGEEGAKADAATEQGVNMAEQSSQGLQVQEPSEKLDLSGEHEGSSASASGNDEADEVENNLEASRVELIFMENAGEELKDTEADRTAEVTGTLEVEETHYVVENFGGISVDKAGEKMVKDGSSESSSMDCDNSEGPDDSLFEAELKLMKARYMKFGPIHRACLGLSAFAIILASLVYIYPARAVRAPSRSSQPVKVILEESNQKEKLTQVQPRLDECLKKKVEPISLRASSTVFFSMEETRKELTYNQAPKIELLGEFVIGKVSSSIRSCGRESKTIEAEGSNTEAMSHEESRAHSVSPAQASSVLDTGSTDSPSYGSFTAEKKIIKKQGRRDGSLKIVTTPVRRSSRLQNRSVTSP